MSETEIREARPGDEDGLFELVNQLGHALHADRLAFDTTSSDYFAAVHPNVFLFVADDRSAPSHQRAFSVVARDRGRGVGTGS
jgi:hypothetical protein